MRIIIDATALDLYPVGKEGFHGGSELYVHRLAEGLSKNHLVHVITSDLDEEDQREGNLFYWPRDVHPTRADAVICVHNLEHIEPYSADLLILASNGIGAYLGPDDEFTSGLDAVACFSQCHKDLLCRHHKKIDPDKCHVTGLGVDLQDYHKPEPFGFDYSLFRVQQDKTYGRMFYANDPQRGLLSTLKIFEKVLAKIPEATLHIAYDFDRVFRNVGWTAHMIGTELWECHERVQASDAVSNLGALTRDEVVREQMECYVHVMPSNPPNVGSQIHGITQMECAAAGCPLVLSDIEAFPEVFGEAANILPVPGAFMYELERRCDEQDWADIVVETMKDEERWHHMSQKSRALAEKNTWDHVVQNWETMLAELTK